MHTDSSTTTARPFQVAVRRLAAALLVCLAFAGAASSSAASASAASASSSPCRAIRSESQLEYVNDLVDSGAIQELDEWGQYSIRLQTVSRRGAATKLRVTHAKAGKSHIAFDYHCPAVLEVTIAKRLETCEPNPYKRKITCAKRWFVTATKERWIRLDQPISLNIVSGPDRMVSVGLGLDPWFIPGKYALNVDPHPDELHFGG